MSHSESHVINNLEVHAHNEQSHGSVKDYLIGFVLSVVLTAIPFWAVMSGSFSKTTTAWCIVSMAIVQIWVHLKYSYT
jgi:Heme/copper-type cytochrome/quinol oxidase, subunit 4